MLDSPSTHLKDILFSRLSSKILTDNVDELGHISVNLSSLVDSYKLTGENAILSWVNEEETEKIFKNLPFKPVDFAQLVRASIINFKNLKSDISKVAKQIFSEKVSDEDFSTEGCWYYIEENKNEKITDAKTTATWLYALYKTSNHLSAMSIFENVQKNVFEWLFNPDVYYSESTNAGWAEDYIYKNKEEYSSPKSKRPNTGITAFILNILLRVNPRYKFEFEKILGSTILDSFSEEHSCWVFDNTPTLCDVSTTCYCLRLISTYLTYINNRPTPLSDQMVAKMRAIQKKAVWKLIFLKSKYGTEHSKSWKNDLLLTALAIQALRTSGVPKNNSDLVECSQWLISKLEYFNGEWCWTKNNSGKKRKSSSKSAIIVSALMRSCSFKDFAKVETVFPSLLKEIEENKLDNRTTAPILCTFTDYLRALDEPYFPDS